MKSNQTPFPSFFQPARKDEEVKMYLTEMPSFPKDSQPFHHDAYRMGVHLGHGLTMMMTTPPQGEAVKDMYINNGYTGQNFRLVSIPVDPTPFPIVPLSSKLEFPTIGIIQYDQESTRETLIAAPSLRLLGGNSPGHSFARAFTGEPLMHESVFGRFHYHTYLAVADTAILLSAIPVTHSTDDHPTETGYMVDSRGIELLENMLENRWVADDDVPAIIGVIIRFVEMGSYDETFPLGTDNQASSN